MTYDKLTVALLSMLSAEDRDSTNAQVARYLLAHADVAGALSIKELAAAAHVGTGTISRFARDAGFASFAELREALGGFAQQFASVTGAQPEARADELSQHVTTAVERAVRGVDQHALQRLAHDLHAYQRVSTYGLLKGQAAALDLQVDLLMQGKWVDTTTALADQMEHIARAGRDELVIVFSYTGAYFEYGDLDQALRRLDRPRIWMVCGARRPQPAYVSDLLLFDSDLGRLGHPYQLEAVAALIAQEYAATA